MNKFENPVIEILTIKATDVICDDELKFSIIL